jgi:hypothetical protein
MASVRLSYSPRQVVVAGRVWYAIIVASINKKKKQIIMLTSYKKIIVIPVFPSPPIADRNSSLGPFSLMLNASEEEISSKPDSS